MHSKYLSGGLFVFDVTAHSLFKSQRQQIQHNVQIMIAQMPHLNYISAHNIAKQWKFIAVELSNTWH